MKWVTRKNANVDRIACPWLIKRFVDKDAEFLYLPADEVSAVAQREGAALTPIETAATEEGAHTTAFDRRRGRLYAFLPRTSRAAVYEEA